MADVELDADADSAVQAFDPSRAVRLLAAGVGGGGRRRARLGTRLFNLCVSYARNIHTLEYELVQCTPQHFPLPQVAEGTGREVTGPAGDGRCFLASRAEGGRPSLRVVSNKVH